MTFTKNERERLISELMVFFVFASAPANIVGHIAAEILVTVLLLACVLDMFSKIIINTRDMYGKLSNILSKIILYSIFIILAVTKEYNLLILLLLGCLYITIILKTRKKNGDSRTPDNKFKTKK